MVNRNEVVFIGLSETDTRIQNDLLILHTGKMKELTRDAAQEDDAEDELPEK